MTTPSDQGILLVNLGTPASPDVPDVRRFLAEFLWDKHVLDINPVARFILLHASILRTRPAKSAAAYRKIWTDRGSPLLFNSEDLLTGLRPRLGEFEMALAMRYGSPSIADGLQQLHDRGCKRVLVCPLYPQYAASSTLTTHDKVKSEISQRGLALEFTTLPAFYDHPGFITAGASVARPLLGDFAPDHVLMSFHGLPERHMIREHPSHCLQGSGCCDTIGERNQNCYRAQCYATARALASSLELQDRYSVSFQSRMGRTQWITPYTDFRIPELAAAGVRRLAVMCPAFVADCLETVEEIGIRAQEQFQAEGGESLILIPSLNADHAWLKGLEAIIRDSL